MAKSDADKGAFEMEITDELTVIFPSGLPEIARVVFKGYPLTFLNWL